MNDLTIKENTIKDSNILEPFGNLRDKEPELRIIYFPQDIIITFFNKIKGKKVGREDINNRLYLRDLNRHFKDIGNEASHKLLDSLEENNKEALDEYYTQLLIFIDYIKRRVIKVKGRVF